MKHLFHSVLLAALVMATGCSSQGAPAGYTSLKDVPGRVQSGTRIYNRSGRWVGIVKGRDSRHKFPAGKRRPALSVLMVGQSTPVWVDERAADTSYFVRN